MFQHERIVDGMFQHERIVDDVTVQFTYVFTTNNDGTVIRQEVPLVSRIIGDNVYLLPDFNMPVVSAYID